MYEVMITQRYLRVLADIYHARGLGQAIVHDFKATWQSFCGAMEIQGIQELVTAADNSMSCAALSRNPDQYRVYGDAKVVLEDLLGAARLRRFKAITNWNL